MATPAEVTVAFCGLGYAGLPVALRAVEVGFRVVGFEIDPARVKVLLDGESYVEDVPASAVKAALETGRFTPSDNPAVLAGFDIAIVVVPTPLRDGIPDLSYIENAAVNLGQHLRRGATVILESTTFPGTTQELVQPILESGSGLVAGTDFHLGYSPERIDPGNATYNFRNTPKVVSGIDGPSLDAVKGFYDALIDTTVVVAGPKEAELAKLLENTFRHVNIALVNELAMYANDLGVDLNDAIDAASTKPFGFMTFRPGPGAGGHCLPIDPSYLSWRVRRHLGHSFRFVELANDINDHMPDYVVRRVMMGLNQRQRPVSGSRILLLGLAYKPNTSDARESPSLAVAERLQALGAEVRAVDALVPERDDTFLTRVSLTTDEVAAADAVVLLADHDGVDYDLVVANGSYVFDTRNRLRGPNVEHL